MGDLWVFTYIFQCSDTELPLRFSVDPRRPSSLERVPPDARAEWTRLEHHKCRVCPLQASHCPAAVDLQAILPAFADRKSTDVVTVRVEGPERTYVRTTDMQTGLQSLIGLVMGSSACPALRWFRWLSYTHLPFASMEETVSRITGYYLLRQYLRDKGQFDIGELSRLYENLGIVNNDFYARVQSISRKEANLNAMAGWSSTSLLVALSLDEMLQELAKHFKDED